MRNFLFYCFVFNFMGCGELTQQPTEIQQAQIDGKNEVSKWFNEYSPDLNSEIITTRYVSYVLTLDKKYNSDINKKILSEWLKNGWRTVTDDEGKKFFCDKNGNIMEVVTPFSISNKKVNGILAAQQETEWLVGYQYRIGGNYECRE
ncbi:hypothetical protein KTH93_19510 [Acinetobacter bereziniae]|uniref:hypothetical protein n=1 Tax=Acinetobacter bereziniae TaxID=106648 RepID=UPI0021D01FD2|nr:hypothetical protein [Acinetobacter bereziniae]MCU4437645.1 hypothetical protein [Acinetobacter bereziniae]